MTTEDKFLIALGVVSVLLLAVGALVSKRLARASPRTIRTVWPLLAAATGATYAVFVFIARSNVKG